jgi:hypothetical protein
MDIEAVGKAYRAAANNWLDNFTWNTEGGISVKQLEAVESANIAGASYIAALEAENAAKAERLRVLTAALEAVEGERKAILSHLSSARQGLRAIIDNPNQLDEVLLAKRAYDSSDYEEYLRFLKVSADFKLNRLAAQQEGEDGH